MSDSSNGIPAHQDAQWFVDVLDAMSDLVLVKGERSRLLWANRAFRDYYGMSNAELRDLIDGPQSDPDDTVQYVKDDQRVYTTGQALNVAAEPVTNRRGEVGYFHTVKTPLFDRQGVVARTVGVSRVIEDASTIAGLQEARAASKADLSPLRALVSNVPLPVLMCDARLRCLESSQAWDTWFQCPARVDGAIEFYEDLFEKQLPIAAALREVIARDGQVVLSALASQSPSGHQRVADVTVRAWRLASGEVGGAVAIVHDVTERLQSEARALQANEELIQFNYRASHDLRSPLRTALGLLDLAGAELDDNNLDEVRRLHRTLAAKLDSLSGLVEAIVDIARADVAGEESKRADVTTLVEEVFTKHAEEAVRAKVELAHSINASSIVTEGRRLFQVLDNLVANAIKNYDPQEARRRVDVVNGNANGTVWFEVRDNGRGVQSERDVFDMFVRGSGDGAGLGLYVVRKHVRRLGGVVTLTSRAKDTVFRVELPSDRSPP